MSLRTVFRRIMAERLAFAGFIFIVLLVLVAIFAPWLTPHDPAEQNLSKVLKGWSTEHWLGTDELGRDVFSRLIMGSRAAIQSGAIAILIPLFIGVPLGIISGYLGGIVDDIFMRIVDGIIAIPAILLALGITAAFGASLWNAMIAIGIIFTPQFARLARGQTLQIRKEHYVEASKISGGFTRWIILRHIIPNIAPPIVVQASFNLSYAVLIEASVSFLGLGAHDPQVSWGSMIQQGYSMIHMNPWLIIYPGMAILLTVLAGNFFGDGLRISLDPKHKLEDK